MARTKTARTATVGTHGALTLPLVDVSAYNSELRDADGFLGDRASNSAFRAILEDVREPLREVGDDPLGSEPSDAIRKKKLDNALIKGSPEAAGVVQAASEAFATELATVAKRLLRLKSWRGVSRIVVGGGLRASRVGELVIGRAAVILKSNGHPIDFRPIRYDPDHAGLIGTVHLAPPWIFAGYDSLLAVDIGGSNIRAGIVTFGDAAAKGDFRACEVKSIEHWRHHEDRPTRDDAVDRLAAMLTAMVTAAEKGKRRLAPFIGVGCPGVIDPDGSIEKGGQNLPGNWESSRFNLPETLRAKIPKIGSHETHVVMHNDAVVQGLSEAPWMTDVEDWAVLTIGTGLGNAAFHTRPKE